VVKPKDAVCVKGEEHQLAIKAIKEKDGKIVPAANENVVVTVKSGPDSGLTNVTVKTDEHGIAHYKCTGAGGVGTDVFEACIGTAACARTAQASLWISDTSISTSGHSMQLSR
jgi:hypothetical protein